MDYDAFVSYSHEADHLLAKQLQSALQRIGKPWYKRRSLSIFRDETDLSATPHGWDDIERALDRSRYLIVLASPRAAESKWVQREIAHWLKLGRGERLLIVLAEGKIAWDDEKGDFDWPNTSAIPKLLSKKFAQEPFWVDVLSARKGDADSVRNPAFQLAVAKIGAPVYGIDLESLVSNDAREHRRTIRHASIAATALVLLFVTATLLGLYANRQRAEAVRQRNDALARQLAAEARLVLNDSSRTFVVAGLLVAESLRRGGEVDAAKAWQEVMSVMPRRPLHRLVHGAQANALAYSPQGDHLAVATGDGLVTLWDPRTGRKTHEFVDDRWDPVRRIRFSDDSRYLQCVGNSETRVWNVDGAEAVRTDQPEVAGARFAGTRRPAGNTMSVVLDQAKGFVKLRQRVAGPERCRYPYDGMLHEAVVSPDGRQVAVGGEHPTVLVWSTACGAEDAVLSEKRYVQARYLPGGRVIATTAADGQVDVWGVDGKPAAAVPAFGAEKAERSPRQGLPADHANGTTATFATDANGHSIQVWRSQGKVLMHAFPVGEEVLSAQFSPDGTLLAAGTDDRYLTLWNIDTGSVVFKQRLANPPDSLRFSHSGQSLLVMLRHSADIIVLDGHTGAMTMRTFNSSEVRDMTLSDDERLLAAIGIDGGVNIWSLLSRKEVMRLDSDQRIMQFAMSPNAESFLTLSQDGIVKVWPLSPQALVRSICSRLTRNMTPEEWKRYLPDDPNRETCSPDVVRGSKPTGSPNQRGQTNGVSKQMGSQ